MNKALFLLCCAYILSCADKPDKIHFSKSGSFLRFPTASTLSPDGQAQSSLFDNLIFTAKDSTRLQKNFAFEYELDGLEREIKLKHDLRYYISKDTGSLVSIKIHHLGKVYDVEENYESTKNENKTLSFTETIPCDSLGVQKYSINITIRNKWKNQFTRFEIDSWDLVIPRN